MPVAQGGPPPVRQALTVGAAMLLGVLAVVFLVSRFDRLGGDDGAQVQLGDPVFPVGRADELAPVVAENGPFLFPGPEGAGRDLWLHTSGPSQTRTGWPSRSGPEAPTWRA